MNYIPQLSWSVCAGQDKEKIRSKSCVSETVWISCISILDKPRPRQLSPDCFPATRDRKEIWAERERVEDISVLLVLSHQGSLWRLCAARIDRKLAICLTETQCLVTRYRNLRTQTPCRLWQRHNATLDHKRLIIMDLWSQQSSDLLRCCLAACYRMIYFGDLLLLGNDIITWLDGPCSWWEGGNGRGGF